MSTFIETDDIKYEEDIKKNMGLVFVLFKSEWCASCKRLWPVAEKVSDDYKAKAKFVWTDATKNIRIAAEYGVLAIPTYILFKGGVEKARGVGYLPENDLKAFVDKNA
ncbi:MAG: thioredoxin domain-containing protein [Candidatus Firestonebacteria bacterium]|nr:thioredoxin domain-containing protein [Candidatus Firestonebacteria bacterium]